MKNSEILTMLRKCHCIKAGDNTLLSEITPAGVSVKLYSHSTADHCHIYLELEGQNPLLVWYKTNWCSPNYEFNEKGKEIGFQSAVDFAKPIIEKLFTDAKHKLEFHNERIAQDKMVSKSLKRANKEAVISAYRKAFSN